MAREDLDFCYLTTVGRKSGLARTIEIWFGMERDTVYLLSGGGEEAHWVQNLQADHRVSVKLGRNTYLGTGRLISDREEDAKARRLLAAKRLRAPISTPTPELSRKLAPERSTATVPVSPATSSCRRVRSTGAA